MKVGGKKKMSQYIKDGCQFLWVIFRQHFRSTTCILPCRRRSKAVQARLIAFRIRPNALPLREDLSSNNLRSSSQTIGVLSTVTVTEMIRWKYDLKNRWSLADVKHLQTYACRMIGMLIGRFLCTCLQLLLMFQLQVPRNEKKMLLNTRKFKDLSVALRRMAYSSSTLDISSVIQPQVS